MMAYNFQGTCCLDAEGGFAGSSPNGRHAVIREVSLLSIDVFPQLVRALGLPIRRGGLLLYFVVMTRMGQET